MNTDAIRAAWVQRYPSIVSAEMKPFANEPILELRRGAVRAQLGDALEAHDARRPLQVPVWVGTEQRTGAEIVSTDPGNPERVVAEAAAARPDEIGRASCRERV